MSGPSLAEQARGLALHGHAVGGASESGGLAGTAGRLSSELWLSWWGEALSARVQAQSESCCRSSPAGCRLLPLPQAGPAQAGPAQHRPGRPVFPPAHVHSPHFSFFRQAEEEEAESRACLLPAFLVFRVGPPG